MYYLRTFVMTRQIMMGMIRRMVMMTGPDALSFEEEIDNSMIGACFD